MDGLSADLIICIFRYLPDSELCTTRLLSRNLNRVSNYILYHKSKRILENVKKKYKIRNVIYTKLDEVLRANYYVLNILKDIENEQKLSVRSELNILTLHATYKLNQIYKFLGKYY